MSALVYTRFPPVFFPARVLDRSRYGARGIYPLRSHSRTVTIVFSSAIANALIVKTSVSIPPSVLTIGVLSQPLLSPLLRRETFSSGSRRLRLEPGMYSRSANALSISSSPRKPATCYLLFITSAQITFSGYINSISSSVNFPSYKAAIKASSSTT